MAGSRSGPGLLGLGVALALGLVASAHLVSEALLEIKQESRALVVKGFAERAIVSDYAVWQGSFTTRAADLQTAYAELARHRELLTAFLAGRGVADGSFELFPVTTQVLFARDAQGGYTNQVEGYALSQQLRVGSSDIDLVTGISEDSSELVRQGVELASDRPQYFYTQLGDLKISMLGEATQDARRRAEVLAENGGGAVGALLSAQQGVFQITPARSTEVSDYGQNDTSSREKTIKAVVTVSYAVDRSE